MRDLCHIHVVCSHSIWQLCLCLCMLAVCLFASRFDSRGVESLVSEANVSPLQVRRIVRKTSEVRCTLVRARVFPLDCIFSEWQEWQKPRCEGLALRSRQTLQQVCVVTCLGEISAIFDVNLPTNAHASSCVYHQISVRVQSKTLDGNCASSSCVLCISTLTTTQDAVVQPFFCGAG